MTLNHFCRKNKPKRTGFNSNWWEKSARLGSDLAV